MSAFLIIVVSLILFYLGYRFYARFIGRKVLCLDPNFKTPAQEVNDGVDYVPTRPGILFGHHFASIAGLGPILGPAIAVVWGWLPAILWIVIGTIFIGSVHDFTVLGLSVRHKGRSIGDVADETLGPRARVLFMLIILFALALAMGVFALVISDMFTFFGAVPTVAPTVVDVPAGETGWAYPQAVLPSMGLIVVAAVIGFLVYKKKFPLGPTIAVGVVLMFALLFAGIAFPIAFTDKALWIYILLAYAFVASFLPVWLLLQPRDFLSSFNLFALLILLTIAFLWAQPTISAPALNTAALGDLPPLVPFLFITIACGAVSGFHGMVSSGTTSKQLRSEPDARLIGYGGMLTESFLAVLVILACVAGYTLSEWNVLYSGWLSGLSSTLGAFVTGAANIASSLGIPVLVGQTFFAVTVVAFAMTSLDTGTRLIRYLIEELSRVFRLPAFVRNRYVASALAVAAIGYFALMQIDGRPAGRVLWVLFGTSNQLLAGIALLVASVYFFKKRRPTWVTFLPMLFMLIVTIWALGLNLMDWLQTPETHTPVIIVGSVILALLVWMVIEAAVGFTAFSRKRKQAELATSSPEADA